jgi:hypothetical protein
LYLKKGILAGRQAAHIWRNDEEIPKILFPKINRAGTVRPMRGPATYQGHGPDKISIINLNYNYFPKIDSRFLFKEKTTIKKQLMQKK